MRLWRLFVWLWLLSFCVHNCFVRGQWFIPPSHYYHFRSVSQPLRRKTGNSLEEAGASVGSSWWKKLQGNTLVSNKVKRGKKRDSVDEDEEYLEKLEDEALTFEELDEVERKLSKPKKRKRPNQKANGNNVVRKVVEHRAQPCSQSAELPHISRRGTVHVEYTTNYPLSCPCKRVTGMKRGSCWVLIDSVNRSCVRRDCNPSFVCVYGIKTGLTCLRKKIRKRVIPTGPTTCKTIPTIGYMYVPYTSSS